MILHPFYISTDDWINAENINFVEGSFQKTVDQKN